MKQNILDKIFVMNEQMHMDIIKEMGLLRLHNECALCHGKIKMESYSMQLCSKCRMKELDKENEKSHKKNKI
jgi:hypothetical protein